VNVKKYLVVVLLSALVGCMVWAGGCGSDTSQAKTDLKQGDTLMGEISNQFGELGAKLSSINTEVNNTTEAANAVRQIEEFSTLLTANIAKAKAQFGKVNSLKGVADYQKYAELQVKILDNMKTLTTKLNAFLGGLVGVIQSSAGTQDQVNALQNQFQLEAQGITETISKLASQASKLKKEKNL
jgi:hypothetical protein